VTAANRGADRPAGPVGYSLPLSPSGDAALLTPPPWHFSGHVVMVEYRVDPALATTFLPPSLDLGPDPGAAALVFAEWQWCSASGKELADPACNQFAEVVLLLAAEHGVRPVARCPGAWVDRAVPLVRGWVQGMPKQVGAVSISRSVSVGRAAPRTAEGAKYFGSLSVYGRRLMEASVTLAARGGAPPVLHVLPLVHSLVHPAWAVPPQPPRLVASVVSDVEFSTVWSGPAEVGRFDLPGDFAFLAPVEVGTGHVFNYAETLHGGQLLDSQ